MRDPSELVYSNAQRSRTTSPGLSSINNSVCAYFSSYPENFRFHRSELQRHALWKGIRAGIWKNPNPNVVTTQCLLVTNTITVMHGMSVNQQYSCASIYGKTDYLDQWFPNCVHRGWKLRIAVGLCDNYFSKNNNFIVSIYKNPSKENQQSVCAAVRQRELWHMKGPDY